MQTISRSPGGSFGFHVDAVVSLFTRPNATFFNSLKMDPGNPTFIGQIDFPEPWERAKIEDVEFVRGRDGVWRYVKTGIPVPGGRDVTLTEHFRPQQIVTADGKVERLVVEAAAIAAAPDLLGWCLTEGTPVKEDGDLIEVLVPYDRWVERDRIPGALFSPEHEGSEAEQQVAAAEREFREAERALEKAAEYRAEVLRRHAGEMTRQEARAITGLSVGRIQQLIHSGGELDERDQMLLRCIGNAAMDKKVINQRLQDRYGAHLPIEILDRKLSRLDELDLIELTRSRGYRLTAEGRVALDAAAEDAEERAR